jgi:hypothetical protein
MVFGAVRMNQGEWDECNSLGAAADHLLEAIITTALRFNAA